MKIALGVPCNLDNGNVSGFTTAFRNIQKALSDHETITFAPKGGDIQLQSDIFDTTELINQYHNTLALSKDFAKKVKEMHPDIILAFTNMGLFLSQKFIYYTSNIPYKKVLKLVQGEYPKTEHFNKLLDYYRYIAEREKINYEKAEKIIVLSQKIKEAIIEEHQINPQKIIYIPRHIPKLYELAKKEEKDNSKKMKIILMPIELRVMRGIRYAIETMKLLKKELPNAVLVICGRINLYEQDYIKNLLNEAKGKANIIVAGFLPKEQLYNYMKIADCAFMPFCFDECPIALTECISYSLPVVTNEYAGFEKSVINTFGYCVAYKDIQDYASAIIRLLTDNSLNQQKRQGAKSIAKQLTFDNFKEEVNNVFRTFRET